MANLTPKKPYFTQVEKFNSLANGEFWRAKQPAYNGDILAGQLLMIAQIDDVDNAPHTVHVRLHPSKITNFKTTVKFLIDDFISTFEFIEKDEADKIRQLEIEDIQRRVTESQSELQEACASSALMDLLIEKEMPLPDSTDASVPVKYEAVGADIIGAIKTQKVTALMSKGLTEAGINQIKSGMEEQKSIAERRSNWISKRTTLLTEIASEMTPYFLEKAAVALALTKDMADHVDVLMNGIKNLNLYVLKDVEIETLREGVQADDNLPLSIAQRVLYMDEELAVWADVSDDWDFRSEQTFKDNIANSIELINQIFPNERSIVSIAASRQSHNYRQQGYSSFESEQMKRENLRQFILIRNGDNIHMVRSPELFHNYSKSLFPTVNETESPFKGFDGNDITYSDLNYTDSLKEHDRIAMGYKRLLILLCGLDHNKQLFGRFYDPALALNFVSMDFQEKYFNFIHDMDGTGMLPTFRPATVNEWIEDLNKETAANSRLIINWSNVVTVESAPSCFERDSLYRSREDSRSLIRTPVIDKPFLECVVEKSDNKLFTRIKVSPKYDFGGSMREFDAKVQLDDELSDLRGVNVLCIDRLNPDDALWYLHDRATRTLNLSSIRIIKHAVAWARDARAETQELRDKLLNAVLDAHIVEPSDKEVGIRLIDTAIAKWQCNAPKRSVNELLEDNKAFNVMCDQIYQLSDKGRDITPNIIKKENAEGRKSLRVSLLANGKYVSYSTPSEDKRDDRLVPFQWVEQVTYTMTKNDIKSTTSKMALLQEFANNETILFEDESFSDHVHANPVFKTPAAKSKLLDVEFNFDNQYKEILALKADEAALIGLINRYAFVREQLTFAMGKSRVIEPVFSLAFAHGTNHDSYFKISFQYQTYRLLAWLVHGNENASKKLIRAFVKLYKDEAGKTVEIKDTIDKMSSVLNPFVEIFKPVFVDKKQKNGLIEQEASYPTHIKPHRVYDYSYNKTFEEIQKRGGSTYIPDQAMQDLDNYFNIKKPANLKPVLVVNIDNFFKSKPNEILVFEVTDELLSNSSFQDASVCHNMDAFFKEYNKITSTTIVGGNHFKIISKLKAIKPFKYGSHMPLAAYVYEEFSKTPTKNVFE